MRAMFYALIGAALLLGACATEPEKPAASAPVGEAGKPGATPQPVKPSPPIARVEPSKPGGSSFAALKDPNNILSKRTIYFDFDRFEVKDEYRPLVEAHAKFLRENPSAKMLIQGNADEREPSQHQYSPLYSMSSRRFFAQHSSLCSLHAGFSSPRLTASIWLSRAPSRISIFFTLSERRWPRPTLYSRLPRSSALPWISIFALGFSRGNLACASTSDRYASLTSNLSKSK